MIRLLLTVLWALLACEPLPGQTPPADGAGPGRDGALPAFRVEVGDAPARGPADAAVTIVEFLDYECPYCAYAHPTLERLLEQYPREVRWVVKHNPLGFHPRALPAALLAIEVERQRGDAAFFEATEQLLGGERLDAELFSRVMVDFALDPSGVQRAFALGSAHPTLIEHQDQALDLEVRGTPAFFVNGVPVPGAQPYLEFARLVEHEIARAHALLDAGTPRAELYAALQRDALPPPGLEPVNIPPTSDSLPALGPASARVTVQIFSDFECPYCGSVMPTLDALRKAYPDDVRLVWRHYPLPFHRHAVLAAHAAEQARVQGGDEAFWRMARRMLGTRENPPERLDHATLVRYAEEMGLDVDAFTAGLSADRHGAAVARDVTLAMQLGINATPGFTINGYRLLGAQPLRRFERLVRLSLRDAAPPSAGLGQSPGGDEQRPSWHASPASH